MGRSNIYLELLRFIVTAVLRSATFIFFLLFYQIFSDSPLFNDILFLVSIYIFICTSVLPNITNYGVLNDAYLFKKVSFINSSINYFIFTCFCLSFLYQPTFLACALGLAIKSVGREVVLLRQGNIIFYSLAMALRLIVPTLILFVLLILDEVNISIIYAVFFLAEIIRYGFLRLILADSDFPNTKMGIIEFTEKSIPILITGLGLLALRGIAYYHWEESYVSIDATVRLIELIVSISTLYFVQRFQFQLTTKLIDWAALGASIGIVILCMAVIDIFGGSLPKLALIAQVDFSPYNILKYIALSISMILTIYASKVLLILDKSSVSPILFFSSLYFCVLIALIKFGAGVFSVFMVLTILNTFYAALVVLRFVKSY